jgi:hypothetical protein
MTLALLSYSFRSRIMEEMGLSDEASVWRSIHCARNMWESQFETSSRRLMVNWDLMHHVLFELSL